MNLEDHGKARVQLVQALAILAFPAAGEPTLKARNLAYHAEELLKALDAYYNGQEETADAGPS
jgi:hypothetical protein